MGLKKLILGAGIAVGISCAGVPKFICSYDEYLNRCKQEWKNAFVVYEIYPKGNTQICSISSTFKNDQDAFSIVDIGCDDATDLYIGMACAKDNMCNLDIKERQFGNPDSESFFKNYDSLFKDREFQEFKEKVLGGKK